MPTLLKDINEASFRVKYGIDELALIKLCQRLGVVAREPPQCPRCNSAMTLATVKEMDGFAWRCRSKVAIGHKKPERCEKQVGI